MNNRSQYTALRCSARHHARTTTLIGTAVEYDEVFDQIDFKRIKVWVIGRIPYQLISAYDLDGDEYYTEPHFYCSFVNNGEPYEEIIYRGVGGDMVYDWPLDESLRLPDIGTV